MQTILPDHMTFVRKRCWLLLLILGSILFSLPLLQRLPLWGIQDWDQHMGLSESSRQILLTYHQFPLWNPYRCGGMTDIGHPQSRFLSPFFPLVLFLGSPVGYKIIFILHIILASVGMFLLARYWKISMVVSFYVAMIFAYSGSFALPFAGGGMTNFVNLAWVPWLILWIYTYSEKKTVSEAFPFILATAIGMTWMFFGGWHYIAIVCVLVSVLAVVLGRTHHRWQPVYFSVLAISFFVGLSAVKLFPAIETIYRYPRFVATIPHDGYTPTSLLFSLLSRNQTLDGWQSLMVRGVPTSFDMSENGMYVGIYSLILFLVGLIRKRPSQKLLIPLFVFLWIILGVNIFPSLYGLLQRLPVFSMMMVAQRYKYFFLVFFALVAGIGFDVAREFLMKRFKPHHVLLVQIVAIVIIFIDLYQVDTPVFSSAFRTLPTQIPKNPVFHQTSSTSYTGQKNRTTTYAAGIEEYPNIYANYGNITCYEPFPLSIGPVQGYNSPQYRGEVYLLKSRNTLRPAWSPNIITLSLQKTLKQDDTLVVNQNYDPNWWIIRNNAKIERPMNEHGLLAAPVRPSDTNVTFLYLPLTFVFGAIVSFLSCLVLGKTLFARSKKLP